MLFLTILLWGDVVMYFTYGTRFNLYYVSETRTMLDKWHNIVALYIKHADVFTAFVNREFSHTETDEGIYENSHIITFPHNAWKDVIAPGCVLVATDTKTAYSVTEVTKDTNPFTGALLTVRCRAVVDNTLLSKVTP